MEKAQRRRPRRIKWVSRVESVGGSRSTAAAGRRASVTAACAAGSTSVMSRARIASAAAGSSAAWTTANWSEIVVRCGRGRRASGLRSGEGFAMPCGRGAVRAVVMGCGWGWRKGSPQARGNRSRRARENARGEPGPGRGAWRRLRGVAPATLWTSGECRPSRAAGATYYWVSRRVAPRLTAWPGRLAWCAANVARYHSRWVYGPRLLASSVSASGGGSGG